MSFNAIEGQARATILCLGPGPWLTPACIATRPSALGPIAKPTQSSKPHRLKRPFCQFERDQSLPKINEALPRVSFRNQPIRLNPFVTAVGPGGVGRGGQAPVGSCCVCINPTKGPRRRNINEARGGGGGLHTGAIRQRHCFMRPVNRRPAMDTPFALPKPKLVLFCFHFNPFFATHSVRGTAVTWRRSKLRPRITPPPRLPFPLLNRKQRAAISRSDICHRYLSDLFQRVSSDHTTTLHHRV